MERSTSARPHPSSRPSAINNDARARKGAWRHLDAPFLPSIGRGILEEDILSRASHPEVGTRALKLFRALKALPIIDPHTHYATGQIVSNDPWRNPAQLFLGSPASPTGFDHYAATVMLGEGLKPEFVYGRAHKDAPLPDDRLDKRRFLAMVEAFRRADPNPSVQWFKIALEVVFDIKFPGQGAGQQEIWNGEYVWHAVSRKLSQPEFRPQEMLRRHGIVAALTTDAPQDSLDQHAVHRRRRLAPYLLPTFRPDPVLMIEQNKRVDFNVWCSALGSSAGIAVCSLKDLLRAIELRMDHFAARGCCAMDLGIVNFPDAHGSRDDAEELFVKRRVAGNVDAQEGDRWRAFMLRYLCHQNAKRGWVQYFHQGPIRDVNDYIYINHGPDAGGDTSGTALNRAGFLSLLNDLYSDDLGRRGIGAGLARTVVFPINTEDYRFVLDSTARFNGNSKGISSKIQLGPPWWFNDTRSENEKVIDLIAERGSLGGWIGMLSDARCLPSVIARIVQFRAILALKLVEMMPYKPDSALLDIGKNIAFENVSTFLGLSLDERGRTLRAS